MRHHNNRGPKMIRRSMFLGVILLTLSSSAMAGQWCNGTLISVYLDAYGSVFIQGTWRNDYTKICNNQGTFGGIDGVTCLSWYGAAVKAQGSQTKVTVYYDVD